MGGTDGSTKAEETSEAGGGGGVEASVGWEDSLASMARYQQDQKETIA